MTTPAPAAPTSGDQAVAAHQNLMALRSKLSKIILELEDAYPHVKAAFAAAEKDAPAIEAEVKEDAPAEESFLGRMVGEAEHLLPGV